MTILQEIDIDKYSDKIIDFMNQMCIDSQKKIFVICQTILSL